MNTRFTEDDFGVTHLAALFHQDWRAEGTDWGLVESYIGEMPIPYVRALAEDALLLTDRGTPDVVATLWESATGSNHRLDRHAVAAWFGRIASVSESRLMGSDQSEMRSSSEYMYGELRDKVVLEIARIGRRLDDAVEKNSWAKISGVAASLKSCAADISPELAIRFLLRALMEYSCNIRTAEYAMLVDFGRDFSYGEFVVSRVKYLVSE